MKTKLLTISLFFIVLGSVNAQQIIKINSEQQAIVSKSEIPVKTAFPDSENSTSFPKQNYQYVRPNADERFKRYINRMVGPVSLGTKAMSAGISTARNNPEEWGGKWKGFGKRFASNVAKGIIMETTIYTMDEAFKLDSSFHRSQKRDVASKFKNGVLSTFTARKPDGKRVVGVPRLVGTYASSIIAAETWYPKRFNYKDGLRNGTISVGVNVAVNLFREFFLKK